MQLFKKVLLSLFPNEIITQNINPASMFVSFISTKEFFSVISRKIVENYKLNLFDIALDPFEFKIWFGDKPSVKMKQLDLYYWYCGVASLNWYRFLNPANISNTFALVVGIYVKDVFQKFPSVYYLNFLYTVYLLSFVFTSRIKVFPDKWEKEVYNWFVDVFFSFYRFVFRQTGTKIDEKKMDDVKKVLVCKIDVFFLLFSYYRHINKTFENSEISDEEYYSWLFYDELKKTNYKAIINDFVTKSDTYIFKTNFSLTEQKILSIILPADILLRYLFMDSDVFLVFDNVIEKIYDKKILDKFMWDFRKQKWNLEEFILYITDYKHFKYKFFSGMQSYIAKVLDQEDDVLFDDIVDDVVDDYTSSIGEDKDSFKSLNVPEKLKKESKMMEKVLNFYITLVGGFWIARGDSFFVRLFRRPMIDEIIWKIDFLDNKKDTLNFYWWLLYNYGKNVFYYKYASENIRAGKHKFVVPYKSTYKNVYSNLSILKLFDQNFLATVLQDISPRDVKIHIKSPKILSLFRQYFAEDISSLVRKNNKELVLVVYKSIGICLVNLWEFPNIVAKHLTQEDLFNLKDSFYSFDFWVSLRVVEKFSKLSTLMKKQYSDFSILWIIAFLRETVFGFLLYIVFLEKEEKNKYKDKQKQNEQNLMLLLLKIIYVKDVLHVSDVYLDRVIKIIDSVKDDCYDLFDERLKIDDNFDFMKIALENWVWFVGSMESDGVYKTVVGEDIIWFRWFLKNITYYNKRFLVPSE